MTEEGARSYRARPTSSPSLISNSVGQYFPVTNSRSCAASYAMPFATASGSGLLISAISGLRSISASTLPLAGSIRAMNPLIHTLARILPPTYSSSFRFFSGRPLSVTAIRPRSAKRAGSIRRSTGVPSDSRIDVASLVMPQPSPV
ncbi:hypothetical protein WR25_01028 [Diploscapter pachys]|uniref:Uncharacterized protein n=1 Tax=Diploscapter pachys TaxID=2018661 RepID=A0A2A2JX30_9BILA|nr:hypothetical protein WR25_01028 [Diploscapter pachys]